MSLEFLNKEAKLAVNYSVKVQKDETVIIMGSVEAIPLIKEIYREVLRAGGHPYTKLNIEGLEYIFYSEAEDFQLDHIDFLKLYAIKKFNVLISVRSVQNTRELMGVPAHKIQRNTLTNTEYKRTFFSRQGTGELKWVVVPYPTIGMAQEAGMSREEFAQYIKTSCFLDKPDPNAEWEKVRRDQQKYCDYLMGVDKLRIMGKNTDLSASVKGRKWINDCGLDNLPDGEIFTGPVEDSLEGKITFSFPGIYNNREIEGIELEFENGEVVRANAKKGSDLLNELLKIPGVTRVGELAIGTNYNMTKFVKSMLFDEKIGGTLHIALGNGYLETGSNNVSSLHWDLLCDLREGGEIYADGKLIYKNGKFTI